MVFSHSTDCRVVVFEEISAPIEWVIHEYHILANEASSTRVGLHRCATIDATILSLQEGILLFFFARYDVLILSFALAKQFIWSVKVNLLVLIIVDLNVFWVEVQENAAFALICKLLVGVLSFLIRLAHQHRVIHFLTWLDN